MSGIKDIGLEPMATESYGGLLSTFENVVNVSIAISLKRIADKLDKNDIAEQLERGIFNAVESAVGQLNRRGY